MPAIEQNRFHDFIAVGLSNGGKSVACFTAISLAEAERCITKNKDYMWRLYKVIDHSIFDEHR